KQHILKLSCYKDNFLTNINIFARSLIKVGGKIYKSKAGVINSDDITISGGKYLLVHHRDKPTLNRIMFQYKATDFNLGDRLDSLVDKKRIEIPYLD
uniref:hypothetical protein n=1 Tax=uncultured Microscilla sp. TaxID=432653 RepID=UPI002626692B